MASMKVLASRLNKVVGVRVATDGVEPPRLVRANSAFAKPKS